MIIQNPVRRAVCRAISAACLTLPLVVVADEVPIEELRVEGTKSRITEERIVAARIPGGVTVVDIEDLKSRNITSLADALRYVPGVWAASASGSDSLFFSSRGSNLDATDYDENGIKLLQDGLPVTTADGNNHNRVIDPLAAQWATVARGANAMTYGASTLGGAVNFVTPTARDRQGYELRSSAGSHGLGDIRLTAAAVADSLDGLITLESKTWEGYRDHSEQTRTGVYANVGWQINEGVQTRFYATWLDNDQELPGGLTRSQWRSDPDQANPNAVSGDFQLNVETLRLANRTSWQLGPEQRIEIGASLEKQRLYHPIVDRILVDFDGPGPAEPVEVFSLLVDTDHRDTGFMARYHHDTGDHAITLGVNFGDNSVDGAYTRNLGGERNGDTNRIDNDATSWELFVSDHWSVSDALTLVLEVQGVVAERNTRNTTIASGTRVTPSGDYDSINPRLGVVYSLSDSVSLYANASRLYEPPTNYELLDDLRANGDSLDAMSGSVLEIGTRGTGDLSNGRWFWDAAVYYARIQDEILSVEDPAAPGTSLSANVDDTIHAGIEAMLGAEFRLGKGSLEPTLAMTLNRFNFDGDPVYGSNDLPAAPEYVVRGEVMYRHPSGFYAGPTFDVIGARWADFTNSYRVGGYELIGLRAGFDAANVRVFVEAHNLLDDDYIATHSVRNNAAPDAAVLQSGAPLSVYAGVVLSF